MSRCQLQRPAQAVAAAEPGNVLTLDRARIVRALSHRERYKYVRPQVQREGMGWKVLSPNCSRKVDAAGGTIDIAWLVPVGGGLWLLHARDHQQGSWVLKGWGLSLEQALARLCADPHREYWL